MSRSIHHTYQQYWNVKYSDFADEGVKKDKLDSLRRSLKRKRAIKKQSKAKRKNLPVLPTSSESISYNITVQDQSKYAHYPLTKSDVQEIMDLLPIGIGEGLSSIVFCLGKKYIQAHSQKFPDLVPDPFMDRLSYSEIPNLYLPPVLGMYNYRTNKISLHAYVYDPNVLKTSVLEIYLKLKMLNTLLHELSHHDDQMRRTARGRWLGCEGEKAEDYAYANQSELVSKELISYIEKSYKTDIEKLLSWIENHGGCQIPIGELIKGGIIFTVQEAVEGLFANVGKWMSSIDIKFNFANELHYAAFYEEALFVLKNLLIENPENTKVKVLMADIHCHRSDYDHAMQMVEAVLSTAPNNKVALEVLCKILFNQERWHELIKAVDRLLKVSDRSRRRPLNRWIEKQLLAYLYLGELEEARAVLHSYQEGSPRHKLHKAVLQSFIFLMDGKYDQATEIARKVLNGKPSREGKAFAKYVYNKGSMKLGKKDAYQMSKKERSILKGYKINERAFDLKKENQ